MSDEHTVLTAENMYNDPYPVYARLRKESPVQFFSETGEILVTRWADCSIVGSKSAIFGPSASPHRPEARVMGMPNILSMTGEDHRCMRQGIDSRLQPVAVNTYVEELARPIVRRYVDAIKARGQGDLTTDLFEPISVRIIATVIGLEHVANETLARWFHAINGGLQNVADSAAVWQACDQAKAEIDAELRPVVERVTRQPNESLISHVIHGGMPDGTYRSFEDIIPTMRVILLGGLQEPGHGAANATLGLLLDPDQARKISTDPTAFAQRAYDEGLRWLAPIGVTPRVAQTDFELAGVPIKAGASVTIVMASANRDESRFEEPDIFRFDRTKKTHVSFGFAPHFCSGHFLSRSIGKIALEETFKSLPNLRLDPNVPHRIKGWRFRGVMNLPARWDA